MTVKVSKPPLNLREELSALNKPTGIAGEAMLRAKTVAEQQALMNHNGRHTGTTTMDGLVVGNGGIQVGGTGEANKLDDYEEGTWTPSDGSGAGLSFSFTNNRYTKVGRLVVACVRLTFPTTSSTSLAKVNLPFTADANADDSASGGVCTEQNLNSGLTITASINETTNTLFRTNGATALTNAQLSGKILRFTVTYQAS